MGSVGVAGAWGRGHGQIAVWVGILIGALLLCDGLEASAQSSGELDGMGALAQNSRPRTRRRTTKKKTTKKKKKTTKKKTTVSRLGPYLMAGVGGVSVSDTAAGYASIDVGPGLTLGFGHRFTSQFSLEGNLLLSIHDAVEVRPTGGTTDPATNTMTAGTVDLKFWFPIQLPRVEGYGGVSVGYYSFDANRANGNTFSGIGLGVLGGVEYRFTREFSAGLRIQASEVFADERVVINGQPDNRESQVPLVTFMPTAMIRL